jgi:hypothetical protein
MVLSITHLVVGGPNGQLWLRRTRRPAPRDRSTRHGGSAVAAANRAATSPSSTGLKVDRLVDDDRTAEGAARGVHFAVASQ